MHGQDGHRKFRQPPLQPRGSVALSLGWVPLSPGTEQRLEPGLVWREEGTASIMRPLGAAEHSLVAPVEGAASSTDATFMVDVAPVAPPRPPVALEGEKRSDRKRHRDILRAAARRNQQPSPVCYNPLGYLEVPDICNRVATDWGTDPAKCMCETQWPKFLAAAISSGQAKRVQSAECYDGVLTLEPGQKVVASYRRPGGPHMRLRWWYNALVESFVVVKSRTGQSSTIAIVN